MRRAATGSNAGTKTPEKIRKRSYSHLGSANVLVEQLGPLDRDKVKPGFLGNGTSEERLAAAGRSVEQ